MYKRQLQYADHPSLDNCREGFKQGLDSEGIKYDITESSAKGDDSTNTQIAQQFVSQGMDLVCGIATPSAQACYNAAVSYTHLDLPTLAFTHFQPAQPTTVGKRASLWLEDLLMDLEDVDYQLSKAKLLGCKGTTGTQASFLELFEGDHEKCKMLDKKIAEKMGYEESFPVSGQTYPRKLDSQMLNTLSLIAQSAYKFSNDIRLLQHLKQIEEPFEKSQIGSSAMAYKRNPMRSERIGSLARYVICLLYTSYEDRLPVGLITKLVSSK